MKYLLFALSILLFASCQKEDQLSSSEIEKISLNGSTNSDCNGDYRIEQGFYAKDSLLTHLTSIQAMRDQGNNDHKIICLDNDVEIVFTDIDLDLVKRTFFNIPEGVTIKSSGAKITTNYNGVAGISLSKIENNNINIDGIIFKAPLSLVASQSGLVINGSAQNHIQNITIKNSEFTGFNESAISTLMTDSIIIDNNYIHHNFGVGVVAGTGYGVNVGSGASAKITNNQFLYNRHAIASSNITANSHYEARNNIVLAEYENDPIISAYSEKQALLASLISIHHFDAHGTNGGGNGGSTGTFIIDDNIFYNNRPFLNDNKIIGIRAVPRSCSSIINNVFPSGNGIDNIYQQEGDNSLILPGCSNDGFKNIYVSGNIENNAVSSSLVDNLIVVKESGDLINYPNLSDLQGEGVLVGNGFLPSSHTHFLVGNWTGNGTSDLIVRNDQGDLNAWKFNGSTFYGQTIGGSIGPIVSNGLSAAYTDYLVGNWTGNGTSDLIIRNSQKELRALKFSGTTFYGQTINGVSFPIVAHGFSQTYYTDYFVGNWTGNGTSDLIIRNSIGELRALKFSGTTFYGQTIGGQSFPVVANGVGSSYTDFLIADWTNDGISDLLMVNQDGKITINKFNGTTFYGQTIGGQTNPVEVFSNGLYKAYYVGDFTGDQYPDLLVVSDSNDLFLLEYIPSAIKFETPELITTNFDYSKILVGNWNN